MSVAIVLLPQRQRIRRRVRRRGRIARIIIIGLVSCFVVVFFASLFWPIPERPTKQDILDTFQRHYSYDDGKKLRSDKHKITDTTTPLLLAPARLISRNSGVKITADVKGNLGPPSVMNKVGTDWLKDRWQAASDMHGTAIRGEHWVQMEFPTLVRITRIVLDWEAAYANDYKIEAKIKKDNDQTEKGDFILLFDSHTDSERRTTKTSGQSPGVKTVTPLHVIHTIDMLSNNYDDLIDVHTIRVYIRKSAMGWGVSLWMIDVYGYESTSVSAAET